MNSLEKTNNGQLYTVKELAEKFGITERAMRMRLQNVQPAIPTQIIPGKGKTPQRYSIEVYNAEIQRTEEAKAAASVQRAEIAVSKMDSETRALAVQKTFAEICDDDSEEAFQELMKAQMFILQATQEKLNRKEKERQRLAEENALLNSRLEKSIEVFQEMKPKADFADAVTASPSSCLIGELAVYLQQNGVKTGQNTMFKYLRENGYLCSTGERYNQPTSKAMDLGLFELKKVSITKPDGTVMVTSTTKVTGEGQKYFIKKFETDKAA